MARSGDQETRELQAKPRPLQHRNNFRPTRAQFRTRPQQILSAHRILIMKSRVAESSQVERLNHTLHFRRKRLRLRATP